MYLCNKELFGRRIPQITEFETVAKSEEYRKSQSLRLLPSYYLVLREKLISSSFLIYSYFNIGFSTERLRPECGKDTRQLKTNNHKF